MTNSYYDLGQYDVVYVVKDSAYNDELKYSLRSVERNFPHNRVWIYGGKPIGVHPDMQSPTVQKGKTKWDKVRGLFGLICENNQITDKFILFNDDFFILNPVKQLPNFIDGTLEELAERIVRKNNGRPTAYTERIRRAAKLLQDNSCTSYNFELHVPIIIDRKQMLSVREKFPGAPASRSMVGNYFRLEPTSLKDNKIVTLSGLPFEDCTFLSTEDRSFSEGAVGKYIRKLFPDKSRFEK